MGVACDSCGLCPIVGPRFNSQVVMNYDLCSRCHALPGADSVAPFRLVQNQSGMSTSTKAALLFGHVALYACQACQDQGLGTLKCLPSSSSKGWTPYLVQVNAMLTLPSAYVPLAAMSLTHLCAIIKRLVLYSIVKQDLQYDKSFQGSVPVQHCSAQKCLCLAFAVHCCSCIHNAVHNKAVGSTQLSSHAVLLVLQLLTARVG